MAEQIKMLFGVNTTGGPWNIVLEVGPDPPREGEGASFTFHREMWGPNENYAKLGHRGSGAGSRDLILNFGTPLLSLEWLKLNT